MSRYGIGISWLAANSAQSVEVYRSADDGSGSPSAGTEELVAVVQAGQEFYIDFLPNDNTLRHYRVRHALTNWTAGAYTPYVRAKPQLIPEFGQPQEVLV